MLDFIKISKQTVRAVLSLHVVKARTQKNMTQEELAEKLNVSHRWIQSIEKGSKIPGLCLAVNLIVLLEIDPAKLITDIVEKMREETEQDASQSHR